VTHIYIYICAITLSQRKPILLETRADSAKTLASMPSGSGPSSPVASGSSTAAAAASSSTGSSSSRGNIVARADDATEASLQRSFAKFIADTTEATTLENAKVGLRWCWRILCGAASHCAGE